MGIKRILGRCGADGCTKRGEWSAEIKATRKNGKVVKKKFWVCDEHAKELAQIGTLKSVTYEETLHFE